MHLQKISPCLWFDHQAEQAAELYCSLFNDSKILNVSRYGEAGPGEAGTALSVTFQLEGQEFLALNGGPIFKFTEAVSFFIHCKTQDEIDHFWYKLVADGGEESMCGWLKDKYGLSWQVVPETLGDLLGDPDPGRATRAMQAMLKMHKLDIQALHDAADGK